jgi:hypothetical protein
MGELEQLVRTTAHAIREQVRPAEFHACKVSLWIKLVRPAMADGAHIEETVGNVHKVILHVNSLDDLTKEVAENMVLAAFGGDVQLVKEMPNLIVKLFDHKAYVQIPGAPPLDQTGQVFLKATVYRWEPSLWDQLFGSKKDGD